jgi:ketopantoate reductase
MTMKKYMDPASAGAEIAPFQGRDVVTVFRFSGPIKKWIAFQLASFAVRKYWDMIVSMLQDIQKGKNTEIDARNGAMRESGTKVNVTTPYN